MPAADPKATQQVHIPLICLFCHGNELEVNAWSQTIMEAMQKKWIHRLAMPMEIWWSQAVSNWIRHSSFCWPWSVCQKIRKIRFIGTLQLNVTLGGIGMEGETGNGPIQPAQGQKKRKQEMTDENLEKRDTEAENGQPQPTAVPTKRSRKPDRPTRGIVGLGMEKPAEGELVQKEAEVVEQISDKAAALELDKVRDFLRD